uniref:Uncharacterized protein n=1 Tax=Pipistrellus kuhlii TaxID=59472 RepID=A0A7J7RN11_PIPKU|nr:hypothetical protein mPipKuh1_010382 [Pipistrellus kuhlii]
MWRDASWVSPTAPSQLGWRNPSWDGPAPPHRLPGHSLPPRPVLPRSGPGLSHRAGPPGRGRLGTGGGVWRSGLGREGGGSAGGTASSGGGGRTVLWALPLPNQPQPRPLCLLHAPAHEGLLGWAYQTLLRCPPPGRACPLAGPM